MSSNVTYTTIEEEQARKKARAEKLAIAQGRTWDEWFEIWKNEEDKIFEKKLENMKPQIELRKNNPEEYFKKYIYNQGYYTETKEYIDGAKKQLAELQKEKEKVELKKTSLFFTKKKKEKQIENLNLDIKDAKEYIDKNNKALEAFVKSEKERDFTINPKEVRAKRWVDICARGKYNGEVYKAVSPNWCREQAHAYKGVELPIEMSMVKTPDPTKQVKKAAGKRRRSRRRKRRKSRRGRKSRRKSKKSRRKRRKTRRR